MGTPARHQKRLESSMTVKSKFEWRGLDLYFGWWRMLCIVPDAQYPEMYRIKYPDGRLSDMVNRSRAEDAATLEARSILDRSVPRGPGRGLHRVKLGGMYPPAAAGGSLTLSGGRVPSPRRPRRLPPGVKTKEPLRGVKKEPLVGGSFPRVHQLTGYGNPVFDKQSKKFKPLGRWPQLGISRPAAAARSIASY